MIRNGVFLAADEITWLDATGDVADVTCRWLLAVAAMAYGPAMLTPAAVAAAAASSMRRTAFPSPLTAGLRPGGLQ